MKLGGEKMKKLKLLVLLAVVLVIGTFTLDNTLALANEKETATNTFSVGKISMKLEETIKGVGENGAYLLAPGVATQKNPTITIEKGSEPCYVFAYIDHTFQAEDWGDTIKVDMNQEDWLPVEVAGEVVPNMYRYKEVVDLSKSSGVLTVFENVSIKKEVNKDKLTELSKGTLTVKAYAHQQENVDLNTVIENAYAFFTQQK